MKFKKNSPNAKLTSEILEARDRQKKERLAYEKEQEELNKPIFARAKGYPPLPEQLDMLWHDIDSGKISADVTSANTWYQTVKTHKENTPMPK
jgi:hypothetical protein